MVWYLILLCQTNFMYINEKQTPDAGAVNNEVLNLEEIKQPPTTPNEARDKRLISVFDLFNEKVEEEMFKNELNLLTDIDSNMDTNRPRHEEIIEPEKTASNKISDVMEAIFSI